MHTVKEICEQEKKTWRRMWEIKRICASAVRGKKKKYIYFIIFCAVDFHFIFRSQSQSAEILLVPKPSKGVRGKIAQPSSGRI